MGTTHVRFRCVQCGTCCRWPGYVVVGDAEIHAIVEYLAMPMEQFLELCTRPVGGSRRLSLAESPDGSCLFLTSGNRCKIHPVKPQQCRDFPSKWQSSRYQQLCSAVQITEGTGDG